MQHFKTVFLLSDRNWDLNFCYRSIDFYTIAVSDFTYLNADASVKSYCLIGFKSNGVNQTIWTLFMTEEKRLVGDSAWQIKHDSADNKRGWIVHRKWTQLTMQKRWQKRIFARKTTWTRRLQWRKLIYKNNRVKVWIDWFLEFNSK